MTAQITHPTPEQLRAFSLGQLPDEDAEVVETHIGDCHPCCETVLGLSSDDTFVALLQEANQPPSDETLGQLVHSQDTAVVADGEIPSALVDHPRYAIVAPVGKGGMGDVFKAEHRMMERTVALKIIKRELVTKPAAVERFRREVKTAAKLSHPNIVAAYDAEQAGNVHFLVMEYVDGVDLARKLKDEGALSIREACQFIQQAALGLQHAHELGMVHRDIKPHNLMVTSDGTVKILDFGLATLATDAIPGDSGGEPAAEQSEKSSTFRLTTLGTMMGTPDFISPEQAGEPHAVDIRSDIYSLGCTFYYLLTGLPPFAAGSVMEKVRAHTDQQAEPIENVRMDIPEEVADIVRHMMAKDPAERFQTPAEVADALAPFVDAHRTTPAEDNGSNQEIVASSAQRSWWPPTIFQTFGFGLFALILGVIVYVATDRGTLVVESEDETVEIIIHPAIEKHQTGNDSNMQMSIVDRVTGSTVKWLRSGEYVLDFKEGNNEFEFDRDRFVLKRGERVIVRVARRDAMATMANEQDKSIVVRQVWGDAVDVLGAVSPNGRYLSFVDWDTGDLALRDLVLQSNRRVTNKKAPWGDSDEFAEFSTFSPDSKHLAYAWFNKDHTYELRTCPIDGGEHRIIYSSDDIGWVQPMDWSRDGKQVLACLSKKDHSNHIAMISVEEKSATILKSLDWQHLGSMRFSPDGKYVVCDLPQHGNPKSNDVFVISTDGSSETRLIAHRANDKLLGWSNDGKSVLFASNRTGTNDAWIVGIKDGERQGDPMLVKPNIGDIIPMGFTSSGAYYYATIKGLSDIYTASFDPESGKIGPHENVAQHVLGKHIAPAWSSQGDLAYLSERGPGGHFPKIVTLSASGQERELSPKLAFVNPKAPEWSPDGRSLLVTARDMQHRQGMHLVDVASGEVKQVASEFSFGEWAPDGKSFYFYRIDDGKFYRRTLETKHDQELMQWAPKSVMVRFAVSPDGEQLAFTAYDNEKKQWVLRLRPIHGGDEMQLHEVPKGKTLRRLQWTSDQENLVIGEFVNNNKGTFSVLSIKGGELQQLDFNGKNVQYVKMRPDGKQLAFNVRQKTTREVSVMENFLPSTHDDGSER